MENKKNLLETIPLSKIEIGKTNPRKRFDEQELQELSESVKQYGVLQPILVRPKTKTKYELVCGERRFRATKMAGLETIPCNIRELSDDEAFELQIIENLERKDVHPLDEADAFKKMLDSGKYTVEDIAAKLAKTETFVAQRLKLTDLIDEVRTDFFSGNLGVGHAVLIARCDEETQKEILKEAHYYNDEAPNYGTISELKREIENEARFLEGAIFDVSDESLLPNCGSCDVCPKQSGANPVLFPDMQDGDYCFDKKCFNSKTDAHIEKEVLRIIKNGEDVVFLNNESSYGKKPSTEVLKMLADNNIVSLIQYKDFTSYQPSSHVDYVEKKGFYIGGSDAGKKANIYVYQKAIEKSGGSNSSGSSEETEIKEEISKIESRAKRALELDKEKRWTKFLEIDINETMEMTSEITPEELKAIFVAVFSCLDYERKDFVFERCFKSSEYGDGDRVDILNNSEVTSEMLNLVLRNLFYRLPRGFGNEYSSLNNFGYYQWLKSHRLEEMNLISELQNQEAEKRVERTNSRLEALQEKLENLKVEK